MNHPRRSRAQTNPTRQRGDRRGRALATAGAPRWRVLVLRYFALRPEGAATKQPRATPWEEYVNRECPSPERAKQPHRTK
jgi:hypothetical protein